MESFDALGSVQSALKTDVIDLKIWGITLPRFADLLTGQILSPGSVSSWILPDIVVTD